MKRTEKDRDEADDADEDREVSSDAEADEQADAEEGDAAAAEASEEPKPKADVAPKRGKKAKRKRKRSGASARDRRPPPASEVASSPSSTRGVVVAVVALAMGGGAGWFARDARASTEATQAGAESDTSAEATGTAGAAPTAGPEGSCQTWENKVCDARGSDSAGCLQAKAGRPLLPDSACDAALAEIPATLAKLEAGRAVCNKLVSKLCTDLGQQTPACQMVTARTKSMPPEQCDEMMGSYDEIVAGLRQMMQRQPMPGMAPGMAPGMPRGAVPMPPPGARPPH